jgi:predicted flavoprotein YhiN
MSSSRVSSTFAMSAAAGGRSFPAVGTDGTGLNLLQGLGHNLVQQYAALTPLKGQHPGGQQLAGGQLAVLRQVGVE